MNRPQLYAPLRAGYCGILHEAAACDPAKTEGAGAAGGLGAALMCVLGAARKHSVGALLDSVEFDRRIRNVSLVGDGGGQNRSRQPAYRRDGGGDPLPFGKNRRCRFAVVGGHIGEDGEALLEKRNCSIMVVADAFDTSDVETMVERFDSASERMFRFIRLGREMERISSRAKL